MNLTLAQIQQTPQTFKAQSAQISIPDAPLRYYRHGWQSWSLAAWTSLAPLPIQKPNIFHPLQIDPRYAHDASTHGSWLGALEFEDGNILLLGALSLNTHVFYKKNYLDAFSEAGEAEWFAAYGAEETVFAQYAEALAARFGRAQKNGAPRVWCSWYSLYTMIDQTVLSHVFQQLNDLPFDVFQIDDGWQKNIGDWTPNDKFSNGMKALADEIHATGRRAGLWLAPLIATASSNLFRAHPDWFLKDGRGKFISAGFNWGEDLYALDSSRADVQTWLADLMRQVRAWGFDYLKLDFLYAGALPGARAQNIPREDSYRQTMRLLREAMGADAFFLACGAPILPSLGLCDALRVGPDVAGVWEKHRDAVLFYNPSIPSTRAGIRASLHRYWLNPLLYLDPDVAYFTEIENSLTAEQKRQLQDLALIFNFKATSDLPQWMTPAEREALREFLEAQPLVTRRGRYLFEVNARPVDFSATVELPAPASGAARLWGAFLAWLGSLRFVLRIFKWSDDNVLKKRRASLKV